MRIKLAIIAVVFAAFLCGGGAFSQEKSVASEKNPSETTKVTITNNKFEPRTISVKAGTEVTWENKEGTHAVTADDGSWSSSGLTAGKTYSHKFDSPGKYPYYCTFHGGKDGHEMSGVVIVTP